MLGTPLLQGKPSPDLTFIPDWVLGQPVTPIAPVLLPQDRTVVPLPHLSIILCGRPPLLRALGQRTGAKRQDPLDAGESVDLYLSFT